MVKSLSRTTAIAALVAAVFFMVAVAPAAAAAPSVPECSATTDVSSGYGTLSLWLRLLRR